jgi:hypothetical protein
MWPIPFHVESHRFSAATSGKLGDAASWQNPRAA